MNGIVHHIKSRLVRLHGGKDPAASQPLPPVPFREWNLGGGAIGLLADAGAHDNLAGSNTMRHLASQIGTIAPELVHWMRG